MRELERLEKQVEGMYSDYISAGEALRVIRDERLFEPDYASFSEYIEIRYGMNPGTAYSYIQASDVAFELARRDKRIRLDQRKARLLYPFLFDPTTLLAAAREIGGIDMSYVQAQRHIIDNYGAMRGKQGGRKPQGAPERARRALQRAAKEILSFDIAVQRAGLAEMEAEACRRLLADLRKAQKRLERLTSA
jgi:hypothetical protein